MKLFKNLFRNRAAKACCANDCCQDAICRCGDCDCGSGCRKPDTPAKASSCCGK